MDKLGLYLTRSSLCRKGKGKQRERENVLPFADYGSQLPKAFNVLGQAFDTASLNDKCRVVVIGVAGWSPGTSVEAELCPY